MTPDTGTILLSILAATLGIAAICIVSIKIRQCREKRKFEKECVVP